MKNAVRNGQEPGQSLDPVNEKQSEKKKTKKNEMCIPFPDHMVHIQNVHFINS